MSRLINIQITPTAIPDEISPEKLKDYGKIDVEDDTFLSTFIQNAVSKLEQATSLVFLLSTVKAHYRQERGGTDVELFFCNGIPLNDKGLPDITGIPENAGISGFDGGYHLTVSGQQDFVLSYDAGYSTLPSWVVNAVMQQALWNYENRGDVAQSDISPEALATIAPFRKTLHEFIL